MHPGSGGTRARWRAGWTRPGGWARERPRRGGPGVGAAGAYRWHRSGPVVDAVASRAWCVSPSSSARWVLFPLDGYRDGLLGAPSQPGLQRRVEGWLAAVRGTRRHEEYGRGRDRHGGRNLHSWRLHVHGRGWAAVLQRLLAVHTAATRATNTRTSAATPAAEAPDRSTRRRDETIRMSRRLPPWPGEEGSGQLNGRPLWPWSACSNGSTSPSTGGAAGHPTAGPPTTSCAAARAAGGVGTGRSAERLS
jgi:hypothetical protein